MMGRIWSALGRPIGGRNVVRGFTASVALFGEAVGERRPPP